MDVLKNFLKPVGSDLQKSLYNISIQHF